MYIRKDNLEIEKMRKGGRIAGLILKELEDFCRIGVSGVEVDQKARELLKSNSVKPAFLNYQGFPATVCLSKNEVMLHGIPNHDPFQSGDLLTIDFGLIFDGLYLDTATSFSIGGKPDKSKALFLQTGKEALNEAIGEAVIGKSIGDISFGMQRVIESSGFQVVTTFTGHGVGRKLHESPAVPCYGRKNMGEKLGSNETLAIEVMYAMGSSSLLTLDDGWTTITQDGKLSAMFEHTVVVGPERPEILTL